jgi:hypothetical protein
MSESPVKSSPRRTSNWDGTAIVMIALGVLMLGLCGSCTGALAGSILWSLVTHPNQAGSPASLIVVGIVGGLPTAGGVVLLVAGISRGRRPPPEKVLRRPPSSAPPPG